MPGTHSDGKVGLIGTGMVGASFAYALMQSGLATELVLIDQDRDRAEGEAMDLNHGVPFVRPLRIRVGDYADLAGSAVVVVCAGANQRPGQTRLDLLKHNVGVVRDVIPKVVAANPEGVILVASNPVDVLTQVASDLAALPAGRVFGSGTILDTARFRYLLGRHYRVDPRSVHAYIIGEHGDSEVPVWSLANIAGVHLRDCASCAYDPEALASIFEQVRTAAEAIIRRKRATYYAIGLGLRAIVEAILRDQRTVLTVSTTLEGQYGVEGIAASLPAVVGRAGAEEVLTLPIAADEVEAFRRSTALLRDRLAEVS